MRALRIEMKVRPGKRPKGSSEGIHEVLWGLSEDVLSTLVAQHWTAELGREPRLDLMGGGEQQVDFFVTIPDRDEAGTDVDPLQYLRALIGSVAAGRGLHVMFNVYPAEGADPIAHVYVTDDDSELADPTSFRLWLDPGGASPEVVADVLLALSNLHRAHGGSGLEFEIDADGVLVVSEAEERV